MSSKPQTTTQTSAPLAGAQSNLFSNLWGDTGTAVSNAVSQPIPQHTVAGPTNAQTAGVQGMLDVAPTLGGGAAPTQNLLQKIASGFFSNPQNDPNFQGAVDAALQPGLRNLKENVLPGIQDTSIRASGGGTGPAAYGGVGGGSPQDISNERALRDWSVGAQNTGAAMAEDAYKTGLGLTSQIPGLAASATTQALTPSAVTEGAGGLQQGFNQGTLQDILNKYMLTGSGPLGFLSQGANIGSAGGFGNKTTVGPQPNMATQWLQGLTGGASGLNSLFGAGPGGAPSAFSNIASGVGSAASGAGNWLSSLLGGAGGASSMAPDLLMAMAL